MKRVCGWCGAALGKQGFGGAITQSICPACLDNLLFQMGAPLPQYLDSLPEPVVMLNAEAEVALANRAACDMLQLDSATFTPPTRWGVVFECANARRPGGCGHTVHCSGCAIRRAVTTTHATGTPVNHLPARMQRTSDDGPCELRITTEKAGRYVLLRIDDAPHPPTGV